MPPQCGCALSFIIHLHLYWRSARPLHVRARAIRAIQWLSHPTENAILFKNLLG